MAKTFSKIVSTKSQLLFSKFVKGEATQIEKTLLFTNLGYKGEIEFKEFSKLLVEKEKMISTSFPEIKRLSEEKMRDVLKNAFTKISKTEKVLSLFNSAPPVYCWGMWASCIAVCGFTTSGEDFWICSAACEVLYAICWFDAEQ